jgi:tRNA (adenine57-N1/adenine58-N1)-methyltransferase catalytic subunit
LSKDIFSDGDLVRLVDQKGKVHQITLTVGQNFFTNHGGISHDDLIGSSVGSVFESTSGMKYVAFHPSLEEFSLKMPRGAAVIYPRDARQIIGLADISPGDRVLEAGVGSGSLTMHILRALAGQGQLVSYEIREDFASIAKKNVERFQKDISIWDLRIDDLLNIPTSEKFDAVLLDLLNPWDFISIVEKILKPGGFLVCYVATTTQMSRVIELMKTTSRWFEPNASEDLHRGWHLQGLAVRPNHKMVGHTGFLVQARLMAEGQIAPVRKMKPAKGAYGPDWQAANSESE